MADDYNPADNLSEEARSKGGKKSEGGAAGDTKAAKKGGKHSHDNQHTA